MAVRIRAGDLRHRIRIEEPTETQDEFGQPVATWAEYATIRAFVEPLTGQERWLTQQARPNVTHKITLRYLRGVIPKYRIVFQGGCSGNGEDRIFGIDSVINVEERNIKLEIMAVEEV